ncbi:MAG: DUF4880 domain-containing protein, partial [Pseudomonadota bacterium]
MTDRSTQEAINWMVALQENPNDDRLAAAFTNWLQESEENRRQWGLLERTRAMASVVADDHLVEEPHPADISVHPSRAKGRGSPVGGVWAGLDI